MEISIAVNYILSHLYTKLPRRRVDSFGEELERYLHAKFQQHWFMNDPVRDASLRCLTVTGPHVDLLFPEAAAASGLDWNEIQTCLPEGLVISIDPGHVACQYQQPNYTSPEFNRFNSATFWPSAPLSLSSSGCSSASSSISSSNVTPNATQVTHQVLYCVQDSWFTCNNSHSSEEKNLKGKPEKDLGLEVDHNDNLATATALSVLADNDDSVTVETSFKSCDQKEFIQTKPFLERNSLSQVAQDSHVLLQNCDTGFNSLESSKLELRNSLTEAKASIGNRDWISGEGDTEGALLSLFNAEMPMQPMTLVQSMPNQERAQIPPIACKINAKQNAIDNLEPNSFQESAIFGCANNCSSAMFQSAQPKYDPSLLHQTQLRFSPLVPQTVAPLNSANHFVQKSISTPSFTAATFAQTKFGSTKLKNHTKRTPNRIISPTNVPQGFPSSSVNGMLQRDSIIAALLTANQQRTGSNLDPGALGRFQSVGNQSVRRPVISNEMGFRMDGNCLTGDDRSTRPLLVTSGIGGLGGIAQCYTPVVQPGLAPIRLQHRTQANALDELLNESNTDSGKCSFTESCQGEHNNQGELLQESPAAYWSIGSNRITANETHELFDDGDWLQRNGIRANELLHPNFVGKSNSVNPSCWAPNRSRVLDTNDDSQLSARMVNMLLEEDSYNDPTQADCHAQLPHNFDRFNVIGNKQGETNTPTDSATYRNEESEVPLTGCDVVNAQN